MSGSLIRVPIHPDYISPSLLYKIAGQPAPHPTSLRSATFPARGEGISRGWIMQLNFDSAVILAFPSGEGVAPGDG